MDKNKNILQRLIDRLDPKYTKICLYASVTVLLTLVAAMVLYFSSGFFVQLWLLICAVLEPMVYGAIISYLLNPAVVKVSHGLKSLGWQRENGRMRRTVGIVVCIVGLLLLVVGFALLMTFVVTRSLHEVNFATLQELFNNTQTEVTSLIDTLKAKAVELGLIGAGSGASESSATGDLGSFVLRLFKNAASIASTMLFSVIFSIYFLMDGDHVGKYIRRVSRVIFGQSTCDRVMGMLGDLDRVFSGYIRGQFTDALVVGVTTSIVLTLVGVPYGPLVGFLTGLGNLIPYVGGPMGFVSIALVCLAGGSIEKMLIGFVCLALIMFIDANVVNPRLLSSNVDVHPLLVIAALIAGSAVGGLAGMLVAVPAAAFLKIQLDRWVEKREAQDE